MDYAALIARAERLERQAARMVREGQQGCFSHVETLAQAKADRESARTLRMEGLRAQAATPQRAAREYGNALRAMGSDWA